MAGIDHSYGNTPLFTAVFNSGGRAELIQLLRHLLGPAHRTAYALANRLRPVPSLTTVRGPMAFG